MKRINDILQYTKNGLKEGTLVPFEAVKNKNVHAEHGIVGQKVETIMSNGMHEITCIVQSQDDWIVTNPTGEKYIVNNENFQKKYIPIKNGMFKPVGVPVIAAHVNEDIQFDLWGGDFNLKKGGVLVFNTKDDIYGIQKTEFYDTYDRTNKSKREALEDAAEILDCKEILKLDSVKRKMSKT